MRKKAADQEKLKKGEELVIPNQFVCPISLDLMKDPVSLSSGITYDRESIESWLDGGNFTCPVTNQVLRSFDQIPNHSLRKMIQDWGVANRSYGVERIPTPAGPGFRNPGVGASFYFGGFSEELEWTTVPGAGAESEEMGQ
ncbi:hypothetical protein OIU76_023004 [Salix suchowensis]|nr:hypothetical protein OIU76_023004 [Salix suchowensis]